MYILINWQYYIYENLVCVKSAVIKQIAHQREKIPNFINSPNSTIYYVQSIIFFQHAFHR